MARDASSVISESHLADAIKNYGGKQAVVWIGRPFCGKDTQTDAYEARLAAVVLKTGPLLKDLARCDANVRAAIEANLLVPPSRVMWEAKKWIVKNTRQPMIHLNGMPRAVEQLPILSFLAERGYKVKVIWFTTREDVCMNRPSRPGREVEDSPENRALRMRVYDEDTLPMQDYLPKYGISESNGNLLLIDNSDLEIAETGRQIINFLGLPVSVYHLFPKSAPTSMHEIEEFVEQRARAVA